MGDLNARLARIKDEIGAVGKDSKMTEGPAKYSYRGIDAILAAAHQALIDHEVTIAPRSIVPTYEPRTSKGGTHGLWASFIVEFEVRGGDESFTVTTIGEALDWSDKASNKAQTAAQKVCIAQLFAIPYGGHDPDHDHPESAPPDPKVDGSDVIARLKALPDWLQEDCKPLVKQGPRLSDGLTDAEHAEAMRFVDLLLAELEPGEPT